MTKRIPMTHPGIILREEFFEPLGVTQLAAAKATGISQSRLGEILAGRGSITADTAARLGRFLGIDPRNWLNLQAAYGKERMSARNETKEILANPLAMKAIRNNKAGKLKSYRVEDIPGAT
jgi:addiction module HigA family antidote